MAMSNNNTPRRVSGRSGMVTARRPTDFAPEQKAADDGFYCAFVWGTLAGWFIPAVIDSILVAAVYLTGVAIEIGVYGAVVLAALWGIKYFQ